LSVLWIRPTAALEDKSMLGVMMRSRRRGTLAIVFGLFAVGGLALAAATGALPFG
jgi:hypothetical protein